MIIPDGVTILVTQNGWVVAWGWRTCRCRVLNITGSTAHSDFSWGDIDSRSVTPTSAHASASRDGSAIPIVTRMTLAKEAEVREKAEEAARLKQAARRVRYFKHKKRIHEFLKAQDVGGDSGSVFAVAQHKVGWVFGGAVYSSGVRLEGGGVWGRGYSIGDKDAVVQ